MCGDLWKKPCATSSSIQRQLRYQHALDHDKGHGQHHCLGSCLPRTAPWLSAKTPHGSDHLPVVFSLQKTATEQSFKPHNSFRYERWGSDIVSKLRKRKPKKARKAHGKARSSYHGGTWTEKSWMGQAEDSILQVCQLTELK